MKNAILASIIVLPISLPALALEGQISFGKKATFSTSKVSVSVPVTVSCKPIGYLAYINIFLQQNIKPIKQVNFGFGSILNDAPCSGDPQVFSVNVSPDQFAFRNGVADIQTRLFVCDPDLIDCNSVAEASGTIKIGP